MAPAPPADQRLLLAKFDGIVNFFSRKMPILKLNFLQPLPCGKTAAAAAAGEEGSQLGDERRDERRRFSVVNVVVVVDNCCWVNERCFCC